MSVDALLDTNVLIYAASGDPAESWRKKVAMQLLDRADVSVSGQVLQEFYNVSTRKLRNPLTHEEAMEWLEFFTDYPCASTDLLLVIRGAEMADRHKISYWDGAVIAAAERLGAKVLYSEDLNHGQHYGPVQVLNPFRA